MEPRTQSDCNTETNEEVLMELYPYNIKLEETQGIAAELDASSSMEVQSTPMEYQISTPDETSFACNNCTEKFSSAGSPGKHLLQHKQKSFKCELCSKTSSNIEQVKAHEKYHANSKQGGKRSSDEVEGNKSGDDDQSHLCNICNEKVRNKSHSYYTHIIKCVMRSKNFPKCKVCSSRFSSSESYEAHFENFPTHTKTLPSYSGNSLTTDPY